MGLNFRKSIKVGPVRANLSKSGIGYSIGGKGFRVTKRSGGGLKTTVGIPGTGISYSTGTHKRKTTSNSSKKAKSASSSNKAVEGAAPSANSVGCSSGCLLSVIACIAVGTALFNWKWFLVLALIVAISFLATKAVKQGSDIGNGLPPEIYASTEAAEPSVSDAPTAPFPEKSEFEIRRDAKIAHFDNDLNSIQSVNISLSEPVPRQLLKNIPEYNFSNITRKTRLDSIFPLVFLDVETTGLAPSKCEILEVSAIKFDTGMVPQCAFSTLCKPSKPIPEEVTAINHITDEMVQDAPTFSQIATALTDFLKGCNIAGHNLDFDLRFIHANGAQIPENVRFYDTLDLAHLTIPNSSVYNYKLDTVCQYYGIWRSDSHRALSDCYATSKIFARLVLDKTGRQLTNSEEPIAE